MPRTFSRNARSLSPSQGPSLLLDRFSAPTLILPPKVQPLALGVCVYVWYRHARDAHLGFRRVPRAYQTFLVADLSCKRRCNVNRVDFFGVLCCTYRGLHHFGNVGSVEAFAETCSVSVMVVQQCLIACRRGEKEEEEENKKTTNNIHNTKKKQGQHIINCLLLLSYSINRFEIIVNAPRC